MPPTKGAIVMKVISITIHYARQETSDSRGCRVFYGSVHSRSIILLIVRPRGRELCNRNGLLVLFRCVAAHVRV